MTFEGEGCTVGSPARWGRLHGREHRTMISLFLDFYSIGREGGMVGKAAWSGTLHGREPNTQSFYLTPTNFRGEKFGLGGLTRTPTCVYYSYRTKNYNITT